MPASTISPTSEQTSEPTSSPGTEPIVASTLSGAPDNEKTDMLSVLCIKMSKTTTQNDVPRDNNEEFFNLDNAKFLVDSLDFKAPN